MTSVNFVIHLWIKLQPSSALPDSKVLGQEHFWLGFPFSRGGFWWWFEATD